MDTRAEMETELVAQLQVAANSSLFPASRITTLIQNSHKWATNLFIWNDLVKAKITSTQATFEYYDYPDNFRSGTIVRLEVSGDSYERKNYEDYLDYKENNSTTTKKMFANYGRFYFTNPVPTADGSNDMTVWGAVQADPLSAAGTETIFTNNKPEGNEAIVQRAFGVAMRRIDPKVSETATAGSIAILAKLNLDEAKATQRDQRLDHPMFEVPNLFGDTKLSPIGRFNYQP